MVTVIDIRLVPFFTDNFGHGKMNDRYLPEYQSKKESSGVSPLCYRSTAGVAFSSLMGGHNDPAH